MVKNLLIMRFGNPSSTPPSTTSSSTMYRSPQGALRYRGRGGYFDEFGIIRDIQQNHLSQVLSLLAMERPKSFSSEDIRDEKVKVSSRSLLSRRRTSSLVSTLLPTASQATRMTRLFPRTATAPLSPHWRCSLTTSDGRCSLHSQGG